MLIIQAKFSAVKQSKKDDFVGPIVNGKLLVPGNENFYVQGIFNSTFGLKPTINVHESDSIFTSLSNTALIELQKSPAYLQKINL
jgi:hypothetical protein